MAKTLTTVQPGHSIQFERMHGYLGRQGIMITIDDQSLLKWQRLDDSAVPGTCFNAKRDHI